MDRTDFPLTHPPEKPVRLWSIGHSTHSYEVFMDLLRRHDIEAVVDVRSRPYSGYNPHFNMERVREELRSNGIRYVHLGRELGAFREEEELATEDGSTFESTCRSDLFQQGLSRLMQGARTYRLAMMCGEKDPMTCHRTHLIGRALRSIAPEFRVDHIQADGSIETALEFESRLMKCNDVDEAHLFLSRPELIDEAYDRAAR